MAAGTKTKPKPTDRGAMKTSTLFADEAFWAGLIGAYKGCGVAKVLSPIIRDELRRMVEELGMDPDRAWAKRQAEGA